MTWCTTSSYRGCPSLPSFEKLDSKKLVAEKAEFKQLEKDSII
jgi:hypothetical protein